MGSDDRQTDTKDSGPTLDDKKDAVESEVKLAAAKNFPSHLRCNMMQSFPPAGSSRKPSTVLFAAHLAKVASPW